MVKGSFKMAFLLAKISSALLFCIFPPTLIGLSTSSFMFVLYSAHFLSHFLMLKSRHLLKPETYVVQIIHDDTLWFTQSNHLLATSKKIDYSFQGRPGWCFPGQVLRSTGCGWHRLLAGCSFTMQLSKHGNWVKDGIASGGHSRSPCVHGLV